MNKELILKNKDYGKRKFYYEKLKKKFLNLKERKQMKEVNQLKWVKKVVHYVLKV